MEMSGEKGKRGGSKVKESHRIMGDEMTGKGRGRKREGRENEARKVTTFFLACRLIR